MFDDPLNYVDLNSEEHGGYGNESMVADEPRDLGRGPGARIALAG